MKAELNFINFVVARFDFEKKKIAADTHFSIKPRAIINRKEYQFHITTNIHIEDKESEFELKMLAFGIFEYKNNDEDILLNFMSINGPAIVFPYIRSFISSFTALSGFDTITLPTLNLSGFKQEIIETLLDLDKVDSKENE